MIPWQGMSGADDNWLHFLGMIQKRSQQMTHLLFDHDSIGGNGMYSTIQT